MLLLYLLLQVLPPVIIRDAQNKQICHRLKKLLEQDDIFLNIWKINAFFISRIME